MRKMRVSLVALLGFACNSALGITDTALRPDSSDAGQQGGSGGSAGSSAGSGGTALSCTSHAECIRWTSAADPSACIENRCVDLLTPDCPIALPYTGSRWFDHLRSDPEPVIFGVFATVPAELFGRETRNYELALNEVSRIADGLPAAGGRRRRMLAVVCRNMYDTTAELARAVDHLIDDLRVPGILSSLAVPDLRYAFRRRGLARHVFFMSAFDADHALVELLDDGLLWHMLSGGEQLGPAYAPLLDRTVQHLRRGGRLEENEQVRVALVTTEDVSAFSAMAAALTEAIELNGGTAQENSPDYFRAVSIISSDYATEMPDYSAAIRLLDEFAPHVIIGAATQELLTAIIPALEAEQAGSQPFYLLSPWHLDNPGIAFLLRQFPDIYSRMAGVNYAAAEDQTVYEDYQARFDAAYPSFRGIRGYDNFYDAAYYMIYAAVGAGTVTPLTGSDLVQGMRRLLSGEPEFNVGPDHVLSAFLTLETPQTDITLNGAMGPPNFDRRTGARNLPGSVWCVSESGRFHRDVLRLDAAGNLKGTFPCFEFGAP